MTTVPAAPPLSCSVYVDGSRLADTAEDYLANTPTALAGLSIVWGRDTVVDQPDTSTASFRVQDADGDAEFRSLLHVGHTVDVYASGLVDTGNQPTDIAEDGSFEMVAPAQRARISGPSVLGVSADAATGERSLRVSATTTTGTGRVDIAPARWSSDAAAWDEIPVASAGETWTVRIVAKFAGTRTGSVTMSAALFVTPHNAAPVTLLAPVTVAITATGWTTLTTSFVADSSYPTARVGVSVTVPAAGAWRDGVGSWAAQIGAWVDYSAVLLDDLAVLAPPQPRRRVLAFTGRISDMVAQPVAGDAVAVDVTAVDATADLANNAIGDVPWLVETIKNRVARIRALSSSPFAADIDPFPGALRVSWRDVDSQPVADLLAELATSADAVLWPAAQAARGFYLWYEDPATRESLGVLYLDSGSGLVKIAANYRPGYGATLSACDVARDPIRYTQDVTDVITRVDLTWLEQTVDDKGLPAPTERTLQTVDPVAEADYGVRRVGVSTQLMTSADGSTIAKRILARSRALGWRADGITWDTSIPEILDQDRIDTALTLLDGTQRIALPLALTDLPDWAPGAPTTMTYLEGGRYSFDGGNWTFELTVSPSGMYGASAKWVDLGPTGWQWRQFDPAISWLDMWGIGVAPVAPTGRQAA